MKKITCRKCVMNSFIDENIQFDNTGLCSHCNDYEKMIDETVFTLLDAVIGLPITI